jgi:hypothetical protein
MVLASFYDIPFFGSILLTEIGRFAGSFPRERLNMTV